MSGFTFNQAGLIGVESQLRPALSKYLRAREREINAVQKTSLLCSGGPFAGNRIDLEAGQKASATFSVGAWCGRYEVSKDLFGQPTLAVWSEA